MQRPTIERLRLIAVQLAGIAKTEGEQGDLDAEESVACAAETVEAIADVCEEIESRQGPNQVSRG